MVIEEAVVNVNKIYKKRNILLHRYFGRMNSWLINVKQLKIDVVRQIVIR